MSPSLFSHAAEEPQPSKVLEPITFEVTVPHPPEQAFEGFTDLIHLWWPVDTHSILGDGSHVEFEETVLTETSDRDEVRNWGDILEWEPGPYQPPGSKSGSLRRARAPSSGCDTRTGTKPPMAQNVD